MDYVVIAIISVVAMAAGFAGGFFCAVKALQMGLKWRIQAERDEAPTTSTEDAKKPKPKPIIPVSLVQEWLTGEESTKDEDDS
jgi:hypothetical protein